MDASLFTIQPAAAEPIYRQIVGQLRRLILGGQLQPGDMLPSVRAMAGLHAINPMTVSRAWSQAEAEGLLERQRGKGMVVASIQAGAGSRHHKLDLLKPHMQALIRQSRELELPAHDVLERLDTLFKRETDS